MLNVQIQVPRWHIVGNLTNIFCLTHISWSVYLLSLRSPLNTSKQICLHQPILQTLSAILWYHIWHHLVHASKLRFSAALLQLPNLKTKPQRYTQLVKMDTSLTTHHMHSSTSDDPFHLLQSKPRWWQINICCRNNGFLPLDTIPGGFCDQPDGLCSLNSFIKSQARASELANYQYAVSSSYRANSQRPISSADFSASVIGLWTTWSLLKMEISSRNERRLFINLVLHTVHIVYHVIFIFSSCRRFPEWYPNVTY